MDKAALRLKLMRVVREHEATGGADPDLLNEMMIDVGREETRPIIDTLSAILDGHDIPEIIVEALATSFAMGVTAALGFMTKYSIPSESVINQEMEKLKKEAAN